MTARHRRSPFEVPVSAVVRGKLKTIAAGASMAGLRRVFRGSGDEHIVVLDAGGKPIGVVSRFDFNLRAAQEGSPIDALISPGVVTVPADTPLSAASALMVRRGLHGLLVAYDGSFACLFAADIVRWVAAQGPRR